MSVGEIIKKHCPVCKEEKDFMRVVEAHEETESFTSMTVIGALLRQWVQTTKHPTAYCSFCGIVVYVGPSAEEVERTFKKSQAERTKCRLLR